MIQVRIPRDHVPERIYAVHVLLYEYLGLRYTVSTAISTQYYILKGPRKEVRIADHFFSSYSGRAASYLLAHNIPLKTRTCTSRELDGLELIWGEDSCIHTPSYTLCHLDLFAAAFFMLTRWEEMVRPDRDEHGRFPAEQSLAFRNGFLERPVVNEYAAFLKKELLVAGVPEDEFKSRDYKVQLTVDVDFPSHWKGDITDLKKVAGVAKRTGSPSATADKIKSLVKNRKDGSDPYDTFDRLMSAAEDAGQKACFFLMVGGEHEFDPGADADSEHLADLVRQIRGRGHHIGLHPSYLAADNPGVFRAEVETFREHFGELTCGRQHYLRFEVPFTWRSWERVGAAWESTMGYPGAIGFRCGTCLEFPVFDVLARRMLRLREKPLIVMDATLKNYMKLTPAEAEDQCGRLRAATARHGGEFLVLWHNSSFATDGWEKYTDVFSELMKTTWDTNA